MKGRACRLLTTIITSAHAEHGLKTSAASLPSAAQLARAFSSAATVSTTREARRFPLVGGNRFMDSLRNLLRDYKQLSKAKLSALVVATCAAGYVAGSKERVDWRELGWVSFGTFLASSSANTLNQIYEVANDARMKRTAGRPLPAGRMSRIHAAAFAIVTGGTGLWILSQKTNKTTACLGAGNIALYAAVYTPLKQVSVINTWIGAVVGAIPPLMGWAAAAGELDVGSLILGAGLYFWQMPHFMALAWLCRSDYAAGGYKMLSLVDATGKRTAACALRNCAYLFPLGALAAWLGVTSPYFAYESAFITAGMLLTAAKFYSAPTNGNARMLFRASLLHLPIFMGAFLLHRLPNTGEDRTELFLDNARRLGLAMPNAVTSSSSEDYKECEETTASPSPLSGVLGAEGAEGRNLDAYSAFYNSVSLPPLPFLPAPNYVPTHPYSGKMSVEKDKGKNNNNGD